MLTVLAALPALGVTSLAGGVALEPSQGLTDGLSARECWHNNSEVCVDRFGGALTVRELFPPSELSELSDAAACSDTHMERLRPHHQLIEQAYVVTHPGVVARAKGVVRELLGVGFPAQKLRVFVGAGCDVLNTTELDVFTQRWFGSALELPAASQFAYQGCPLRGEQKKRCVGVCCTLSHMAALVHAYGGGPGNLALPRTAAVAIFEHDAVLGPAFFADSTLGALTRAAADPSWQLLKLGECQTYSDEEGDQMSASEGCAASSADTFVATSPLKSTSVYEALQRLDSFASLDVIDPRRSSNYCAHAYVTRGDFAQTLVRDWYPPRVIFDDVLLLMCNGATGVNFSTHNDALNAYQVDNPTGWLYLTPGIAQFSSVTDDGSDAHSARNRSAACLRLEKYAYKQNHSLESTIVTSSYDEASTLIGGPTPYFLTISSAAATLGAANGTTGMPVSDLAVQNANASSTDLWASASAACDRRAGSMSLCAADAFCPKGNSSRLTHFLQSSHWLPRMRAMYREASGLWIPVVDQGRESWLQLSTCRNESGLPQSALSALVQEVGARSGHDTLVVGCCQQRSSLG